MVLLGEHRGQGHLCKRFAIPHPTSDPHHRGPHRLRTESR